jgi:predicted nucleic acid-binding Zn ribbon protein
MPETTRRFDCPNCGAEYKVVRAEGDPPPDRQIECRRCGGPLQGRDGKFILKLLSRGSSKDPSQSAA